MTSLAVDPFPPFAWLDKSKQFKAATKIIPDRRASVYTYKEGWFQRAVCEALKVRENSGIVCKRNQHAVLLCRLIHCQFSSAMKIYPAGFLKTLPPNRPLPSNHSQRVANIKTKNASIAVSLLLLSSSSLFPLLMWLLSLSGAKNLPVWAFFTQMTANFVRFVFKKSTGNTICKRFHTQTVLAKLRPINNSWRDADSRIILLCKRSFHYCEKIRIDRYDFFLSSRHKNIFRDFLVVKYRYILETWCSSSVTFHWQDNL